ncbi:MAG: AAA family ATPase [Desulfobacterales bacterium]|nr:AAA family ATPase [Desulfobacterales bacterium]
MNIQEVLNNFDGVIQAGSGYNVICPAHEDKSPSLSISQGEKGIILHCHAGCKTEDILRQVGLGMKDLFDTGSTVETPIHNKVIEVTEEPYYIEIDEEPYYIEINLAAKDPLEPYFLPHNPFDFNDYKQLSCNIENYSRLKNIPIESLEKMGVKNENRGISIPYFNENGDQTAVRRRTALISKDKFRWNKGAELSLYGLWRLPETGKSCFLVEGESDCHTLWQNNIPALGIPGANNWKEDRDASKLERFEKIYVVIESKSDGTPDPGGESVLKWLKGSSINSRVKLITLPYNDISEMYCHSSDQFMDRLNVCVEQVGAFSMYGKQDNKSRIVCINEIADAPIVDNHLIEGFLQKDEGLIISAAGGVGKSLLGTYMALALGNPPKNGLWGKFNIPDVTKTLIVQSENGFNAFNKRLNKLFNVCPEMREGAKNVFTIMVGDSCQFPGNFTDKFFQEFLTESMLKIGAGCLLIDPLISYHGEDENDNAAMRRSLDCLTLIGARAKAGFIVTHHNNKGGGFRGASSIRDWAACMWILDVEEKRYSSNLIRVKHDKSRNYEYQPDFWLERTNDLNFLFCAEPGTKAQNIDIVIKVLTDMGGHASSQDLLKNAIMAEKKCSKATAQRMIKHAIDVNKVVPVSGDSGRGGAVKYRING